MNQLEARLLGLSPCRSWCVKIDGQNFWFYLYPFPKPTREKVKATFYPFIPWEPPRFGIDEYRGQVMTLETKSIEKVAFDTWVARATERDKSMDSVLWAAFLEGCYKGKEMGRRIERDRVIGKFKFLFNLVESKP